MRSYPNWPEYLMIRDTGLHDDQGGLGQRIYTTAGAGYKKVRYVREDLASAPAPASGGVDAVLTEDDLRNARFAAARMASTPLASLSPAATPVSEAGGLRDTIFAVLRNYRMSSMHCEDEPSCAFPLVDLMSNEGTSIETGELEMRILADEIAGAVYAHADEVDLLWAPDALEDAGYTRDFGLQSAFADMADRMIYAENRVAELEAALAKPASSPAGGDVALRALYEWYDRDGSVGGATEVFEKHRAALSQSTSAGRVGE